MADSLAKRMTDNQIRMASDDLIRDSDRLAADARNYADSLKSGSIANSGMASRLAQAAADLGRRASRLDGMRDIAALINEEA
jgi:hypothetical protein